MKGKIFLTIARWFFLMLLLPLAACTIDVPVTGIEQSGEGGAIGPQEIEGATEIVKFDPALIPLSGAAVEGTCAASTLVTGTYRCELAAGGAVEPCFAVGDQRLLCGPDPVTQSYATLVNAGGGLPSIVPPSPDRAVEFFIELENDMTCALRIGPEPVILAGVEAKYDCSEPYTFVMGFEKSAPAWEAAVYTLDPDTSESSGKVPVNVRRVWIP